MKNLSQVIFLNLEQFYGLSNNIDSKKHCRASNNKTGTVDDMSQGDLSLHMIKQSRKMKDIGIDGDIKNDKSRYFLVPGQL